MEEALILKIGAGSPCFSPPAPERDSSRQVRTAVTGPQKSPTKGTAVEKDGAWGAWERERLERDGRH